MKAVLTVIGTRPEAIKLGPVIAALRSNARLKSLVCVTSQHTDLLSPFLTKLKIDPDYTLDLEEQAVHLGESAARILSRITPILLQAKPSLVLVQGDTTTAFAAALAAFYAQIPVAHVEAGLRTGNLASPWPEEGHRCLIAQIASYAFAPTHHARERLLAEGISPEKIWVVGNTSMDAVRTTYMPMAREDKRDKCTVVVTIHRRENQGEPLQRICNALRTIARQFTEVNILTLLHPNPAIREPLTHLLSGMKNITLLEPMEHASFLRLIDESLFVMTDSGGVQEEAAALGKPLLVLRETTERPESIHAGTSKLVGTQQSEIVATCQELLRDATLRSCMSKPHASYGDGYAAEKIARIVEETLNTYD